MSSKRAEVGDFVFWEYSPGFGPMTYLGGIVTAVYRDGHVRVEGYGTMTFNPVHVTDAATGKGMFTRLKAAEERRTRTIADANASFEAARDSLFKKNG